MQYTKKAPKPDEVWAEVEVLPNGHKIYEFWSIVPRLLGRARMEQKRRWVTDDSLVFASSVDIAPYFAKRDAEGMRTIEPGEYRLEVESVSQASGRIEIRLRTGQSVVIRTA